MDSGRIRVWRRESLTAILATCLATVAARQSLPPIDAAVAGLFAGLVSAAAVHDVLAYRLPDILTAAIFGLGLAYAAWDGAPDGLAAVEVALMGAAIAAALLIILRAAYARLRGRTGLGLGDVKLIASGAAWLPLDRLAWGVLVASLAALAAVLSRRLLSGREAMPADLLIPYGAFLGPSFWLVWYLSRAGIGL